jgi:hypothetical protein
MVQRLTDMITVRVSPKLIAEFSRFIESMTLWTLPINVSYMTPFLVKLAENIFHKLHQRSDLDQVALFLRIAESKLEIFSGRKVILFSKY